MLRRRRLLTQIGLLGILAALAFPGDGLAIRPTFHVLLTATGPSPSPLTMPAGLGQVAFSNTDTVAHTFAFANGWCSAELAPGAEHSCGTPQYVGDYAYTVDGATEADVKVEAVGRSVSLRARTHSIRRGSQTTLRGRLWEANSNWSPPNAGQPQRIIVIARPYVGHPFHRVAVVMATVHPPTKRAPFGELRWHVRIRPRSGMTYVAIASYQPAGGTVWQRATSKPFRVNVRH
jgi:hypothetical protein